MVPISQHIWPAEGLVLGKQRGPWAWAGGWGSGAHESAAESVAGSLTSSAGPALSKESTFSPYNGEWITPRSEQRSPPPQSLAPSPSEHPRRVAWVFPARG